MRHERARQIHFVGIGGIGMSGIAEVLLTLGYQVGGSDLQASAGTARLRERGATITLGHAAANLGPADVVVCSSAIKPDNPELIEARRRGLPVLSRGQMLAELMRLKQGVAIAGTHGKTTITSLTATVLAAGGLDPTAIIGGRVKALGSNAVLGQGPWLVAEADESDGSFLALWPTIAVISNIEAEHLDHWRGGLPELQAAFTAFANQVPFYGLVVACADDPAVREILPRINKRQVTYGLSPEARYRAVDVAWGDGCMRYAVRRGGGAWGQIELRLLGQHNVLNSLAVLALGDELGIGLETMAASLAQFAGVARRLEPKGGGGGVRVYDDYGHHPTEIAATLDAARRGLAGERLLVAFQPHRYSRLRDHFEAFATCFAAADLVFVTEVYPAGEEPLPGVSGARLAERLGQLRPGVSYAPDLDALGSAVLTAARSGDVVLTIGAGSISRLSDAIAAGLQARGDEERVS